MPVKKAVRTQIVPVIISQMISLIYSLADTYFVGLLNDPVQTATVAIAAPVYLTTLILSNLFGIGGAGILARHLGKKEPDEAARAGTAAFWAAFLSASAMALVIGILNRPILLLCGASETTYLFVRGYVLWTVILGGPAVITSFVLANLIRAEGNAAVASLGLSMGGILNMLLDPLFVLPRFLGMGAVGAGFATGLSNLFTMLFFLLYIRRHREESILRFHLAKLRGCGSILNEILKLGFPSAIQYLLLFISVSFITRTVSSYSTEAIAAFGIVKKLNQLPLYFALGVASGLLPILSYNYGSGNQKRRNEAFLYGSFISCSFACICLLLYEFLAPHLVGLFIKDPATVAYGASFLRIQVIAMPLMAICQPMIVQFQAMGRVKQSLICSFMRKGGMDIPLLLLLNHLLPLYGCMGVQPIADCLSLIAALFMYRRINRELTKG